MNMNIEIMEENENTLSQKFSLSNMDAEAVEFFDVVSKSPVVINLKNKEKSEEGVTVLPTTYTLRFIKEGDKYFLNIN